MNLSKRVSPTLLTDQVYDSLHAAILSGELPGGSRLRIRDIAEQVGTSVMPVREAIRRLEEAGLATREPHKGAVVAELTLEELVPVYETRSLLEVAAARAGAASAGKRTLVTMRAEYKKMRAAIADGRVADSLDHDEAFLAALYEASGNPVIVQLIRGLWLRCRAYKIVGAQSSLEQDGGEILWRYQQRLIDAAEAGDGEAAATVSAESLASATDRIRTLLATQAEDADDEN